MDSGQNAKGLSPPGQNAARRQSKAAAENFEGEGRAQTFPSIWQTSRKAAAQSHGTTALRQSQLPALCPPGCN